MKSKTFFNPWLYVLLFLFCSTFLCAQESEDNVASSIYFGFGLCLPTKTLIDYYPGDPTHGKGYRLSGGEYFVSHLFTFKNQGIITSFNYAVNQYNYKGQLADDISLTQVQADDSWKQMEFLTGYYRKFLFHKHLFIDMKIQGGLLFGNFPLAKLDYQYSSNQTREIMYQGSWSTGIAGRLGAGATYKLTGKTALRFGVDYGVGRINHLVPTTTNDYHPAPVGYSSTESTSIIPAFYWSGNFKLGLLIQL
jgi:hypothetical protein